MEVLAFFMKNRNISNAGHFSKANFFLKESFFNSWFLSHSTTSHGTLLYFFQLFHHLNPEISSYQLRNHRPPRWHGAGLPTFDVLLLQTLQVTGCLCCCPCMCFARALLPAVGYLWLQVVRCLSWCRAMVLQRFRLGLKNRKRGQPDGGCQGLLPSPSVESWLIPPGLGGLATDCE